MKVNLCKCNNCGSILYDENPKIGAKEKETDKINQEILPMELLNDGETYWGCGNCQTDAYLTDFVLYSFFARK